MYRAKRPSSHGRTGRRWLTLVCGFALLVCQACMPWRTASLSRLPERIRVQTVSESEMEMVKPSLEGDSVLVGTEPDDSTQLRIPVDEIEHIDGKVFSFGQTLLLSVVTGYALALGIFLLVVPKT